MRSKSSKLQSILKQAKFRTSFRLTLYLNQFVSISLAKQGYYFVTATLCPKIAITKQSSQQLMEKSLSKSFASEVFKIQYNNHNEILGHMATFTFVFQQTIPSTSEKKKNKLLLVFQLFRCINQKSQQPERKLQEQYQCVGQFTFELKTNENLSFLEYFEAKFQYPFAAELNGVAVCLMTNFQCQSLKRIHQLQKQLAKQNRLGKIQAYEIFSQSLKKLLKKHRFASFTVLNTLSESFIGFKNIVTIPNTIVDSGKIGKALITSAYLHRNSHIQNQSTEVRQDEIEVQSLQSFSRMQLYAKLQQIKQKQCTEEEFITHLANIQFQDRQIQLIAQQIQNTGKKNLQSLKQLLRIVRNYRTSDTHLQRVNFQGISTQYQSKKCSLYTQKVTVFGKSLGSAAEQMKKHQKTLQCLKSNEKQSNFYFMKMNQIFHLIPDSYYDFNSINFDKCPYVIHSFSQYLNGILMQQFQKEQLIQNYGSLPELVTQKSNSFPELAAQLQMKKTKQCYRNLFILAHGYQASSNNMQKLKISLKKLFKKSKFLCLKSYSNHMDRSLQQMGQRASKQIEAYIKQASQNSTKKLRVIMLGHSMGGIILRASFQYINQKMRELFHTFITFGTPHLGYIHCKHFITGTGIKLIQSMHPSLSLKQLSNKDSSNLRQTYMYKLCDIGSLKNFQNIIVLASMEDKYVPWNSARIQLYKQPEGGMQKSVSSLSWQMNKQKQEFRQIQKQMMQKILGIGQKQSKLKVLHRFQVDFNISQFNLDTVIGRTAHVAFLNNEHILSIVFQNCLSKTLYKELKNY